MSQIKTLAFKFLVLTAIIVCLNYLYKYTYFERDIQQHSDIINIVRKPVVEKCEILYLGESSDITMRADDIDKRTISSFISDYYPSKKLGSVIKAASHAGIYYELLRNIPETSSVKTVIITLNARSFGAEWIYSKLETPLQKSIVLLKDHPPLFSRFLLSFRGYDIRTDEERLKQVKEKWKKDIFRYPYPFLYTNVMEWDRAMAEKGIKNNDGTVNIPLTRLACNYIKTYAFQIDTLTNPRIKDFDRIVTLAEKRHWNLVFNLLAENMERADSLVGKDLTFLMEQNRDLLVKRYSRNNVFVVDNFNCVRNDLFIDQNWTTEHYAEQGRKIIAKNVAACLRKIYPDDYREMRYTSSKPYEFFNDCEGKLHWGPMLNLSEDRSHSGKRSSKTGQTIEFSVTFEYAIRNIPDSAKQAAVDFYLYQTDLSDDAKLIIDIFGDSIEHTYHAIPIKDLTQKTKEWDEVIYRYTFPEDFRKGDFIKIYVYNPTNSLIYIDDFKIKMESLSVF